MIKPILTLTASALILAGSAIAANSQQNQRLVGQQDRPGSMMGQQEDDMIRPGARGEPAQRAMRDDRDDDDDDDDDDRWNKRGAYNSQGGPYGMRGRMMGSRMGGEHMMRMMMIMLDTDGDGALSLDEIQAVHARFFKAIDADADGKATLSEIQAFMSPMGGRAPGR